MSLARDVLRSRHAGLPPFAANRARLAVASEANVVRSYHRESTLAGHDGCVNALAWSLDGRLLATGSDDLTVRVWRYPGGALAGSYETGHRLNVFSVAMLEEDDHGDPLLAVLPPPCGRSDPAGAGDPHGPLTGPGSRGGSSEGPPRGSGGPGGGPPEPLAGSALQDPFPARPLSACPYGGERDIRAHLEALRGAPPSDASLSLVSPRLRAGEVPPFATCGADGEVRLLVPREGSASRAAAWALGRHAGAAYAVASLPGAPCALVSVGEDGYVKVWDARTPDREGVLRARLGLSTPPAGHAAGPGAHPVRAPVAAGSPTLASAAATASPLWPASPPAPSGASAAAATLASLPRRSRRHAALLGRLRAPGALFCLAIDPISGHRFAVGGDAPAACVYDLRSLALKRPRPLATAQGLEPGCKQVTGVRYARDGRLLVSYAEGDVWIFERGVGLEPGTGASTAAAGDAATASVGRGARWGAGQEARSDARSATSTPQAWTHDRIASVPPTRAGASDAGATRPGPSAAARGAGAAEAVPSAATRDAGAIPPGPSAEARERRPSASPRRSPIASDVDPAFATRPSSVPSTQPPLPRPSPSASPPSASRAPPPALPPSASRAPPPASPSPPPPLRPAPVSAAPTHVRRRSSLGDQSMDEWGLGIPTAFAELGSRRGRGVRWRWRAPEAPGAVEVRRAAVFVGGATRDRDRERNWERERHWERERERELREVRELRIGRMRGAAADGVDGGPPSRVASLAEAAGVEAEATLGSTISSTADEGEAAAAPRDGFAPLAAPPAALFHPRAPFRTLSPPEAALRDPSPSLDDETPRGEAEGAEGIGDGDDLVAAWGGSSDEGEGEGAGAHATSASAPSSAPSSLPSPPGALPSPRPRSAGGTPPRPHSARHPRRPSVSALAPRSPSLTSLDPLESVGDEWLLQDAIFRGMRRRRSRGVGRGNADEVSSDDEQRSGRARARAGATEGAGGGAGGGVGAGAGAGAVEGARTPGRPAEGFVRAPIRVPTSPPRPRHRAEALSPSPETGEGVRSRRHSPARLRGDAEAEGEAVRFGDGENDAAAAARASLSRSAPHDAPAGAEGARRGAHGPGRAHQEGLLLRVQSGVMLHLTGEYDERRAARRAEADQGAARDDQWRAGPSGASDRGAPAHDDPSWHWSAAAAAVVRWPRRAARAAGLVPRRPPRSDRPGAGVGEPAHRGEADVEAADERPGASSAPGALTFAPAGVARRTSSVYSSAAEEPSGADSPRFAPAFYSPRTAEVDEGAGAEARDEREGRSAVAAAASVIEVPAAVAAAFASSDSRSSSVGNDGAGDLSGGADGAGELFDADPSDRDDVIEAEVTFSDARVALGEAEEPSSGEAPRQIEGPDPGSASLQRRASEPASLEDGEEGMRGLSIDSMAAEEEEERGEQDEIEAAELSAEGESERRASVDAEAAAHASTAPDHPTSLPLVAPVLPSSSAGFARPSSPSGFVRARSEAAQLAAEAAIRRAELAALAAAGTSGLGSSELPLGSERSSSPVSSPSTSSFADGSLVEVSPQASSRSRSALSPSTPSVSSFSLSIDSASLSPASSRSFSSGEEEGGPRALPSDEEGATAQPRLAASPPLERAAPRSLAADVFGRAHATRERERGELGWPGGDVREETTEGGALEGGALEGGEPGGASSPLAAAPAPASARIASPTALPAPTPPPPPAAPSAAAPRALTSPSPPAAAPPALSRRAQPDPKVLRPLGCFRGHKNVHTVKGVSFLGPDDELVASGSDDGRLFVWRVRDAVRVAAREPWGEAAREHLSERELEALGVGRDGEGVQEADEGGAEVGAPAGAAGAAEPCDGGSSASRFASSSSAAPATPDADPQRGRVSALHAAYAAIDAVVASTPQRLPPLPSGVTSSLPASEPAAATPLVMRRSDGCALNCIERNPRFPEAFATAGVAHQASLWGPGPDPRALSDRDRKRLAANAARRRSAWLLARRKEAALRCVLERRQDPRAVARGAGALPGIAGAFGRGGALPAGPPQGRLGAPRGALPRDGRRTPLSAWAREQPPVDAIEAYAASSRGAYSRRSLDAARVALEAVARRGAGAESVAAMFSPAVRETQEEAGLPDCAFA